MHERVRRERVSERASDWARRKRVARRAGAKAGGAQSAEASSADVDIRIKQWQSHARTLQLLTSPRVGCAAGATPSPTWAKPHAPCNMRADRPSLASAHFQSDGNRPTAGWTDARRASLPERQQRAAEETPAQRGVADDAHSTLSISVRCRFICSSSSRDHSEAGRSSC